MTTVLTSEYQHPTVSVGDDWNRRKLPSFEPTSRQALVIAAVRAALESGLYYTADVLKHCVNSLGLDKETALKQGNSNAPVEGGIFGMDCYYARDYLDVVAERNANMDAWASVGPVVGNNFGTVAFNDGKKITGWTVTSLMPESYSCEFTGKRGGKDVRHTCTVSALKRAVNRAFELGLRKDASVVPNIVSVRKAKP
jgi:hypothetical protein